MTDNDLGYINITTQRLREMDEWEHANPPESGFRIISRPSASARVRARLQADTA